MIAEVIAGVSAGIAVVNGGALFLVLRQYLTLAEISHEFAAGIVESVREEEDGAVSVDALAVAGQAMDHLGQLGGLVRWMRG